MNLQAGRPEKEVVLTVPFDSQELDTVRLTLYGVAVRMGFSYEAIEDLKVALMEACNYTLLQTSEQSSSGCALRFAFMMRPDELAVRLEGVGRRLTFQGMTQTSQTSSPAGEQPTKLPELDEERLGLVLMQALVDDIHIISGTGEQSEGLELVKRLA